MKTSLPALLIAAIPLVCLGDEPETIKGDMAFQSDYVRLAPAGDPPTFSALRIPRVVGPEAGKPVDRSNEVLRCDPARLRRVFRLETPEVLLGEPVLIEFRIELDGPGRWDERIGGNYRGLGRDGNFFFLMRHQDGAWVPDIFEGHVMSSFGGLGGSHTVKRGEPQSDWLAVQQWCAIDRPGVYDLYAFHWGGLFVERWWAGRDGPDVSPIAGLIPGPVKARLKGAAHASDYAHFTLTVRRGEDQERQAMVKRWTERAAEFDLGMMQEGRSSAAKNAMALARQDDFLPELKRRLRDGERSDLGVIFLGLAMRDDPRAVDMLFAAGVAEAIEVMQFLRPSRVAAAIPRLIDLLTSHDHVTRAAAEEMLRRWTGQEFGHTWEGYDYERPTLAEGRAMQTLYRSWWERNKPTFQPRFR